MYRNNVTPAYPGTYLQKLPPELREITERMRYSRNINVQVVDDPTGKGMVPSLWCYVM